MIPKNITCARRLKRLNGHICIQELQMSYLVQSIMCVLVIFVLYVTYAL
jgi:hypothetical protein